MTRSKTILLSIFLLVITSAKGQDNRKYNWFLGGRYHYGFIHSHRPSIKYNITDHISGMELYAGRQYTGDNIYDILYRYPEAGLAYYYGSLSNNEIYGKVHAIYSYFSASLYRKGKYSSNYLIGLGLSYTTKPFDLQDNYLNIAIGTNLNAFLKFAVTNDYQLSERIFLTNEIVVIHNSNGRIKSPNKGLNQVTTSIGLKYFMDERVYYPAGDIPDFNRTNELSILAAYATKTIDHFNTGRYNVMLFSFDYSRVLSYKRKFMAGIDISYDGSLIKRISIETGETPGWDQAIRLGLHVGQEVRAYDVGLIIQIGTYIYNKFETNINFLYQRYGIRYYVTDELFATAILKAHLGKANYLCWGLGYNF